MTPTPADLERAARETAEKLHKAGLIEFPAAISPHILAALTTAVERTRAEALENVKPLADSVGEILAKIDSYGVELPIWLLDHIDELRPFYTDYLKERDRLAALTVG